MDFFPGLQRLPSPRDAPRGRAAALRRGPGAPRRGRGGRGVTRRSRGKCVENHRKSMGNDRKSMKDDRKSGKNDGKPWKIHGKLLEDLRRMYRKWLGLGLNNWENRWKMDGSDLTEA